MPDASYTDTTAGKQHILALLSSKGIKIDAISVDEHGYIHIPLTKTFRTMPELPSGYALKGGAARWLLAQSLGIKISTNPRDFDIIRLASKQASDHLDNKIAARYMPDDHANGHGVQLVHDEREYFSGHDFTINELYATTKEIVASPACIEDTLDRTIRLTEFEQAGAKDKLLAKALRFVAESQYSVGKPLSLDRSLADMCKSYEITPFHIALHLDRAWQRGTNYAKSYVSVLKLHNQLPASVDSPEAAVTYLSSYIEDFEYSSAARDHNGPDPFESLRKHLGTIDEFYRRLAKQESGEHKKQQKMPKERDPDADAPANHFKNVKRGRNPASKGWGHEA